MRRLKEAGRPAERFTRQIGICRRSKSIVKLFLHSNCCSGFEPERESFTLKGKRHTESTVAPRAEKKDQAPGIRCDNFVS